MPEGLTLVSVIAGFALIAAAGAKLGAGTPAALAGLFPAHGTRDWPTGVQEADAPHFVLAASPSPWTGSPSTSVPPSDTPAPEIEELYAGPIR
jgi:hypothetical protein